MSDWAPRHRRRTPGNLGVMILLGTAVLLVLGSLWAVATLFSSSDDSSEAEPSPSDEPVAQSRTPGEPDGDVQGRYRISIPTIDVAAPVVAIPSEDRVLIPPKDPMLAGWWSTGSAPGDDRGTALVIGHAVEDGEAVFNDVGSLSEGDTILVSDGTPLTYTVSDVTVIDRADLPERADELFAQDGPARLVLVTCDDWDGNDYQSNIIVTAEQL